MTDIFKAQFDYVQKGFGAGGSTFEGWHYDTTTVHVRRPVQTTFFSTFFSPQGVASESSEYVRTIITKSGIQLPQGKRYDEIAGKLDTESAVKKLFEIGSWGLAWEVHARDIKQKINPKTGLKYTLDEKQAEMTQAAANSWNALDNISVFRLLTTDTNYTNGNTASHTPYNYFQEFYGTSRPVAVSMNLAGAVDHAALFRQQEDLLKEDAIKEDITPGRTVVLCGTTFFNSVRQIEQAAGNARPIEQGPDLLSTQLPEMEMGGFRHSYFDAVETGIRFIHVNDSVATGEKIGANDAYMLASGVNYFSPIYCAADTFAALDSAVQRFYAWTKSDDRSVVRIEESNTLWLSAYPRLIRKLTV